MIQSVFVNKENKAIFTCPKCTKAKTSDVSTLVLEKKKLSVRVKCPCGHIYSVILERRKYYRKKTSFPGIFKLEQNPKEYFITVTNLSRFGLQFYSSESDKLQVGDRIGVEFRLDDKIRSLIRKKVLIRRMEGNVVGAEFCAPDEYDKVLGFYLFN
jgi:hypothetical protein